MRSNWKEVPKDEVKGQWAALYVSMNPKGRIMMSRVTYERMNEPPAFTLLFDDVNNLIGFKPTALSARNAYRACVGTPRGGRVLHAYRLIQDEGIRLPQTIRFQDPDINEDGILVLDLRTACVS
jgi:hypothetical protein